MEEVDSIILQQLRDAGCSIEDEKVTIKELEADEILVCAAQCLAVIDEEDKQMSTVTRSNLNMATKYKVATHIASKCIELGYKGELGYQSFLYGAESEVRKVFLFLVDKLPRDHFQDDGAAVGISDQSVLTRLRKVGTSLTWLPPMTPDSSALNDSDYYLGRSPDSVLNSKSIVGNKIAPNRRKYFDNYARLDLNIGSIIEWNSSQLNPSQPLRQIVIEKTVIKTDDIPRERSPEQEYLEQAVIDGDGNAKESYEERLKAKVIELETKLESKQAEHDKITNRCSQLKESVARLEVEVKAEKDRLLELRSQDKTISDLTDEVALQEEDMRSLELQWLAVESALRSELDQFTSNQKELDEIKKLISSKQKEMKEKELVIGDLKEKIPDPMPPGRNSYTKRILEIVNNVKKQNQETNKVLVETRALQKEINLLQGKVQRAFTVNDEAIFREAKSSEWHKKCYKLLAAMRENCDQVMDGIEETGQIKREVLKLEELMDKEQFKLIGSNLVRIQADLKQLKIENQKLINMRNAIAKQNNSDS